MVVNAVRAKEKTNIRTHSHDEAVKLAPPVVHTLESAIEWIADDELVEVTPDAIRIRKRLRTEAASRRAGKRRLTSGRGRRPQPAARAAARSRRGGPELAVPVQGGRHKASPMTRAAARHPALRHLRRLQRRTAGWGRTVRRPAVLQLAGEQLVHRLAHQLHQLVAQVAVDRLGGHEGVGRVRAPPVELVATRRPSRVASTPARSS